MENDKKNKISLQTYAKNCRLDSQTREVEELYSKFSLEEL